MRAKKRLNIRVGRQQSKGMASSTQGKVEVTMID